MRNHLSYFWAMYLDLAFAALNFVLWLKAGELFSIMVAVLLVGVAVWAYKIARRSQKSQAEFEAWIAEVDRRFNQHG